MANPAPGFIQHPDHEVRIEPLATTVEVFCGPTRVARSTRALQVFESRYAPVCYLPMDDVDQHLLTATSTDTYCPFKGHARYWSLSTPQGTTQDALWAYQNPYDECQALAGYVAFYPDKVKVVIDAG